MRSQCKIDRERESPWKTAELPYKEGEWPYGHVVNIVTNESCPQLGWRLLKIKDVLPMLFKSIGSVMS